MFRTLNQKRRPVKRTLGMQTMERREMMAGDATEFTTRTLEPQTVPSVFQVGMPNNSISTATFIGNVSTTVTRTGSVGVIGDPVDFWKFRVRESGTINVRLEGMSRDLDMFILDALGREVARGTNGSTTSESVDFHLIPGQQFQDFFVKVVPFRFTAVPSNYRLTINVANNSPATAHNLGTIRSNVFNTGTVGGHDPVDVFRLQVETSGLMRFQLTGMTQDLDVFVVDAAGNTIASGRRGGTNAEDFTANLTVGRNYFVRIVPFGFAHNETAQGSNIPVSNYGLRVTRV